ncbi:MAG: metallophosphoesterase [Ruminococcus sp.]|nr:metallophosphoesterase [Ruminococcus sp.]
MKIIALSDTHRNYTALDTVLSRHADADMIIHLGDGEEELDTYLAKHPHRGPQIWHVAGNCDRMTLSPPRLVLDLPFGHRLLAVHGHNEQVKFSYSGLLIAARKEGADLVLFGHTHERLEHYEDGIWLFNPGSASCPRNSTVPTYGAVDITESGILTNIIPVSDRSL